MFGIGVPELLVIMIVALIVLGPKRLPEVAKGLGQALAQFRQATRNIPEQGSHTQIPEEEEIRQAECALPMPPDTPQAKEPEPPSFSSR